MVPRIMSLAALAGAFLGWSEEANAKSLDLSATVELVSRYVDDELSVYTDGLAVQPEVVLAHEPSGCYVSLWGSVGITKSRGNEVDYFMGCEHALTEEVSIEAWVGYYQLRGVDEIDISGSLHYRGAAITVSRFIPTSRNEDPGWRIKSEYTHEWKKFSLQGYGVYDTGSYDGVPSILVAGLKGKYQLSDTLSVSGDIRVPVVKKHSDSRDAQFIASLTWGF